MYSDLSKIIWTRAIEATKEEKLLRRNRDNLLSKNRSFPSISLLPLNDCGYFIEWELLLVHIFSAIIITRLKENLLINLINYKSMAISQNKDTLWFILHNKDNRSITRSNRYFLLIKQRNSQFPCATCYLILFIRNNFRIFFSSRA